MSITSWQAESNGYGFAFRYACFIPKSFPLLFMCQHGCQFNFGLDDSDIPNHYPLFLTWHPLNNDYLKERYAKEVRTVCNPISAYFRIRYKKQSISESGLIHYFSHSGSGFSQSPGVLVKVLMHLASLKAIYGLVTMCFHKNDFNQKNIDLCESFGIRVVTNHSNEKREFVDNLITNALAHKYVSGSINQSAVLYAIDFGLSWIGNAGDDNDHVRGELSNSEYLDDPYPQALISVANAYLGYSDGESKLRSMVRVHIGVPFYNGRTNYALQIWSSYFHLGIVKVLARHSWSLIGQFKRKLLGR